jgi:CubicO group peptidase (beta-lactamase class C family)
MTHTQYGYVATGWERVYDAFARNLQSGEDIGAGCAVYHRGELVVDLVGGWRDRKQERPYDADVLQLVFSCTKGVTSLAVAMCVDRGLINYDAPVATYWPEFGQHGKEAVTVAQLLSHQSGLFTVDGDVTLEEALDWDHMVDRLAAMKPRFPVGSTHGYHAITFGWLAGELVRRTDGRNIGAFVQEEIAGPLGIEFYIGLPDSQQKRVAHLMAHPLPKLPAEEAVLLFERSGPGTNGAQALSLNGAFREGAFNREDVRAGELAGANGVTNAKSLAALYAHVIAPLNGVTLLSDAVRERATHTVTPDGESDVVLISPTTFGMGFMTHGGHSQFAGPGSFGHSGAGGSFGFAQPSRELAMSYVMNTMLVTVDGDPRAQRLTRAAVQCAEDVTT